MGGEYGGGDAELTAQEPVGEPGDVGLVVRAFQHADVASYSVHSGCEGGEIVLEGADVRFDLLQPDGHLEELVGEDMAAQGLPERGVALQGLEYVFEGVDGGGHRRFLGEYFTTGGRWDGGPGVGPAALAGRGGCMAGVLSSVLFRWRSRAGLAPGEEQREVDESRC